MSPSNLTNEFEVICTAKGNRKGKRARDYIASRGGNVNAAAVRLAIAEGAPSGSPESMQAAATLEQLPTSLPNSLSTEAAVNRQPAADRKRRRDAGAFKSLLSYRALEVATK